MKKTIEQECTFCDSCAEQITYPHTCDHCGKEYCYECSKDKTIALNHAVYFEGTGDGCYCKGCANALVEKKDPRMMAFLKIRDLRVEQEKWGVDFERRRKQAEEEVKRLQPSR